MTERPMPGGFKAPAPVGPDEAAVLDAVKSEVESSQNKTYSDWKGLLFSSQVVAGVNYMFKVIADGDILHVKVHKPLPHTGNPPKMIAISAGHTMDSPLEPIHG